MVNTALAIVEERKITRRRIAEAGRHGIDRRLRFGPEQQSQVTRGIEPCGKFAPLDRAQGSPCPALVTRNESVLSHARHRTTRIGAILGPQAIGGPADRDRKRVRFLEHDLGT